MSTNTTLKTKAMSILLVLAMCLSMLPMSVSAAITENGVITLSEDDLVEGVENSGTGWIFDGYTLIIDEDYTLKFNGTCTYEVMNFGTISGGTFRGSVDNYGSITGGTFFGGVYNHGSITGATDLSGLWTLHDYNGSYGRDVKLPKVNFSINISYNNCEPFPVTLNYSANGSVVDNWTVTENTNISVDDWMRNNPNAAVSGITQITHDVTAEHIDRYDIAVSRTGSRLDVTVTSLVITLSESDLVANVESSGTGWSFDGYTLTIDSGYTLNFTGTCQFNVENYGTISGGTFHGDVNNYGSITGGAFHGDVNNYGSITGTTDLSGLWTLVDYNGSYGRDVKLPKLNFSINISYNNCEAFPVTLNYSANGSVVDKWTVTEKTNISVDNWMRNNPNAEVSGITQITHDVTAEHIDRYDIAVSRTGSRLDVTVTDSDPITAGVGISSIEKTKTEGLVDTYTITYTDGTASTFTVTNGAQGEQGIQGIQGVPGKDGHTPVITIQDGYWYVDGVNTNVKAEGIKGDAGNGISSIAKTKTEGLVDTYTITYTNGSTTTFTVTNGAQGEQGIQGIQGVPGKDGQTPIITIQDGYWYVDGVNTNVKAEGVKGDTGNGISSIEMTGTNGFVDTYTITFTDGSTTTFTVTNGKDGADGKDGYTPVITIQDGYWYVDGINTNVKAEGVKGDTGNGISSIEKTGTNGLVDTYTITFTNGSTTTFTVTNGKDGADGKDGLNGKDGADGKDGLNGKDGTNGKDGVNGRDGANGADGVGIAKIEKTASDGNVDTYTITLTNGQTYTFTVTNGVNGADGKDGLTPFIGENGNWWIGDTDTGVQAAFDGSIPTGSGAVVENDGNNIITIIAIVIACLALAGNLALVAWVVTQKKKSLV